MADNSGVRIPPPLYALAALAVGVGLGYLWPLPFAPAGPRYAVGSVLAVAGLALFAASAFRFHRAGTPLEPWRTTTALVVTGPYRVSRNPVYVAFTLVYGAVALFLNEAWLLVTLVPALLALRYAVIAREERYLETKFGEDYRRYKASVRRWL